MVVHLITWYDAAWHPVTVFTSQMLSEQGHEVRIVSRTPNSDRRIPGEVSYGFNARVYPVGRGGKGFHDHIDYLRFMAKCQALAWREKPDIIIGYDMHGLVSASLCRISSPKSRIFYHNLDLVQKDQLRPLARILKILERIFAQSASGTVFSSPGRAKMFKTEAKLSRDPLIMLNCQRLRADEAPSGELRGVMKDRNLEFDRIVIRLGSIGSGHAIESTINSIPYWQGRWGLVLAGFGSRVYMERLRALVAGRGLENRVLILPGVSFQLWYDCLYSGHVGVALYEIGENVNHEHMAGAGNKLNLYLKAGIPSIVPEIADFVQMIEAYQVGKTANPRDPQSIGEAINAVLADNARYAEMCQNAKSAFMSTYNFERQFKGLYDMMVLTP